MQLEYVAGACNIGPEEIARRQRAAQAGLIATIVIERAVTRGQEMAASAGAVDGCTSFAVLPERSKTGETLIKRKTLQINFVRPTDDNRPVITDIRPDNANGPAEEWIYRTTSVAKAFGGRQQPKKNPPPPPPM